MLEVSAGTGRNLPYYSKAARSLTISDTSKNMLWHARQKHDRYSANLPATFCLADAQNMLHHGTTDAGAPDEALCHSSKVQQPDSTYQDKLQTFSLAQFDTVIDTFGLCSHADPVAALKVATLASHGCHLCPLHAEYEGPGLQHMPFSPCVLIREALCTQALATTHSRLRAQQLE